MIVGVCRVVLGLAGNQSLKGKRAIVKRVCERAKQRFGVAAAEVDALDQHQRAVVAFACVANDARHVESVLQKVLNHTATTTEAVVLAEGSQHWRPHFEGEGWSDDDLARWETSHAGDDDE